MGVYPQCFKKEESDCTFERLNRDSNLLHVWNLQSQKNKKDYGRLPAMFDKPHRPLIKSTKLLLKVIKAIIIKKKKAIAHVKCAAATHKKNDRLGQNVCSNFEDYDLFVYWGLADQCFQMDKIHFDSDLPHPISWMCDCNRPAWKLLYPIAGTVRFTCFGITHILCTKICRNWI